MTNPHELTIDGTPHAFTTGETVLGIIERLGRGGEIPTLCHDPRLEPAGACRTCLVEIDGWRRLAPSCATKAQPGMVIHTRNDRIERHRKVLFGLYLADNVETEATRDTACPSELHRWADRVGAPTDYDRLTCTRDERPGDPNPYIAFRADRCIGCAQCTRYCEEVEAVSAITLAGRGSETTIATADGVSLLDSTCEMCGGCIDVCPTGAMTEKAPLTAALAPASRLEKVRTTCNFCGVGCQMDLNVDPTADEGRGRVVKVTSPPAGTLPNDGNLCVKGRFAYDFIRHQDRLTRPLVRSADGRLVEASWEEALRRAAEGLLGVKARHGADALGFVSSSRCTGEENYLVQKLARAVFGTNNVHQCAAT
jgi:predicted molibdopterin-dependent oxidoreductase YjgC